MASTQYENEMNVLSQLISISGNFTFSERDDTKKFCIMKNGNPVTGHCDTFFLDGDFIYGELNDAAIPVLRSNGAPVEFEITSSQTTSTTNESTIVFLDEKYDIQTCGNGCQYLLHEGTVVSEGYAKFLVHAGHLCGYYKGVPEIIIHQSGLFEQEYFHSWDAEQRTLQGEQEKLNDFLGKNYSIDHSLLSGGKVLSCKGNAITPILKSIFIKDGELHGRHYSGQIQKLLDKHGMFVY